MIIPDVNVLIHAYNSGSPTHKAARAWWERTWSSLARYPRVAIRRVRSWLSVPGVAILTPGDTHAGILFELLEHWGTAGNLTTDAHFFRDCVGSARFRWAEALRRARGWLASLAAGAQENQPSALRHASLADLGEDLVGPEFLARG